MFTGCRMGAMRHGRNLTLHRRKGEMMTLAAKRATVLGMTKPNSLPRFGRLRTCVDCDARIPAASLSDLCLPCQRREYALRGNPDYFEGERWHWKYVQYAAVHMVYGTLQTATISYSARAAWKSFCHRTSRTKQHLISEGYRVKRIRITPDWKTNSSDQ
jgi:hypothetical protein